MRRHSKLLLLLGLFAANGAMAADAIPEYQPKPAVWKMADADTEIYMLGTIHALPRQVKWRNAALDGLIDSADELVVETKDDGSNLLNKQLITHMLSALDRKPLLDRIDPKNRETLKNLAGDLKLSMDYLDLVPTWMVAFVLFYSGADGEGVSPEHGVETILEAKFKDAKKPIHAIENADAVDASLNKLSEQEQMISLNEMLTEIRTAPSASLLPTPLEGEQDFADDIAWAKGDVESVGADMTPETLGAAYYRALLVDRNAAWTKWLDERMAKPGKILLAVGAAHLAGPDSVQMMLVKMGRKVERVQ
jgi:uncharacterized protein